MAAPIAERFGSGFVLVITLLNGFLFYQSSQTASVMASHDERIRSCELVLAGLASTAKALAELGTEHTRMLREIEKYTSSAPHELRDIDKRLSRCETKQGGC